jgi:hypothetical protein
MPTSSTARRARILAAALAGFAALSGLGMTAAQAAPTDETTVLAFHETDKPFDSNSIPTLNCPYGSYLRYADYSPGRIVAHGVQVIEPGGIGVTAPNVRYERAHDATGTPWYAAIGTNTAGATATNWDPFTAHDLTINLVCTSDVSQAVRMAVSE